MNILLTMHVFISKFMAPNIKCKSYKNIKYTLTYTSIATI